MAMEGSRVEAEGSKVVVAVVDNTCTYVSQLCRPLRGIPSGSRTLRFHTSYSRAVVVCTSYGCCLCNTLTSGVYVIQ